MYETTLNPYLLNDAVSESYARSVEAGQKAARDRLAIYQRAYAGRWIIELPARIETELRNLGILTNMCMPVVDAFCAKLDLHAITTPDEKAQTVLEQEYDRNQMDEQTTACHKEAAICGDAYQLVWPDYTDTGEKTGHANVYLLQSEDVELEYEATDVKRVARCKRVWNVPSENGKPAVRRDIITAQQIAREIHRPGSGVDWEPYTGDGLPWLLENELGVVPVVHFKTKIDPANRPFGLSQLEAALPIQRDINAAVLDLMTRSHYNAGMQLVITGVNADVFKANNKSGLDRSPWSAHMWGSSEAKEYAISGDDLKSFELVISMRTEQLAAVTGTPLHYLSPGLVGSNLSGKALEDIEGAFANKIQEAQTLLGSAYKQLFELMLRICGYKDAPITIAWEHPFAQDTSSSDRDEYKLGLIDAREYHRRRGLSAKEIDTLLERLKKERNEEADALFSARS